MKRDTKKYTMGIKVLFISFFLIIMVSGLSSAPPQNPFDVAFETTLGLNHVDMIISITNNQDTNDNFPFRPLLNQTSIDVSKTNTILYEQKSEEYEVLLCHSCDIENCWPGNGTVDAGCDNVTIHNCNICGNHTEIRERFIWLERNLISEEKDTGKKEIRSQFEEVQIKKGETKKFKIRYSFGEIPMLPSGRWGSYGNVYLDVKGVLFYDFEHSSWWNISMTRWPLITLNDDSNPFLVNDTFGLDIGGGIQYIWCNATATFIYNDTNGNIYCANDTTQIQTFIDEGNGTDFGTPEKDLLLWWHANTTDDHSIYDITVTNTGGDRVTNGKVGSAFDFVRTNTDHVDFADDAIFDSLTAGNDHSFCLWMNIDDWNMGVDYDFILNNEDTGSYPINLRRHTNDAFITWLINTDAGDETLTTPSLPSTGAWHHLCGTAEKGANAYLYIDGIIVDTEAFDKGATLTEWKGLRIGCRLSPTNRCMNGLIDEFMLWNRSLSINEIVGRYNNTHPDNYSYLGDMETFLGPLITFDSQIPSDITSTNIMNVTANTTYNIIGEELNISTIRLETEINTSSGISYIHINGISNSLNRSFNYSFNVSENFTTILDDNDIYPASYTIEHETMDNSAHAAYVAGNNNQLIKNVLLNVSNSSIFSFFEIMTNSSSGICDLFYCNSSYTTGLITTTPNCGGFAVILPNTPFNHTHSGTGKSSHIYLPLGLNTTTGTISGVQVTPLSYFIVRGDGCNTFYINNNTGTAQTSNNNGNSWTAQLWTVDSHLHQFDDDIFYYRQCANNTLGDKFCSDLRFDNLDVTHFPPSAPFIIEPQEGTVRGFIDIIYEECISPTGNAIDYYNISLLYPNLTFFDEINNNNSLNLSFIWNSSLVVDDDYRIRVNCVDNISLNTSAFSGIITIFNNITIEIPDSATFCFSDSVLYIREVETITTISGLLIEENSTVIERFIRCNNGCSNSTLTNWGNPGCEEDPMVIWVALLITVILLVLLFRWIIK